MGRTSVNAAGVGYPSLVCNATQLETQHSTLSPPGFSVNGFVVQMSDGG